MFAAESSRCKSRPLRPGNLTSNARQIGAEPNEGHGAKFSFSIPHELQAI